MAETTPEQPSTQNRLQMLSDFAALVRPGEDFPLKDFTGRVDPASRSVGYDKGAMVFHLIRKKIGDRAFFAALREVCRERLYREASWDDFIRAFSTKAGRDLAPFIRQWLDRPGGPRLALANVARERKGGGWLVSGSVVQTPPFFALDVPLVVEAGGKTVRDLIKE